MKSGIINVYKEPGYTSFDVVARLRGILHIKKIGHTGTLDPDATGVLPVCFGKATKVCDLLTDKEKEYKAVMRLGVTTDTLDISGKVLTTSLVEVTKEQIVEAIESFVGDIMQVPPMYSALKVNGKKLYELAREGIEIPREARPVTIHYIDIVDISLPDVTFVVGCSKGTYIRTLCDDIGKKLGCGAAMASLIRTQVDVFKLEDSIDLDTIQKLVNDGTFEDRVYSIDQVFRKYAAVKATEEVQVAVVNGGHIPVSDTSEFETGTDSSKVRLYDYMDRFVGIYHVVEDYYKLDKMFLED